MINYSLKDLHELLDNTDNFKSELINSKGFLLHFYKKNNIVVPIQLLKETINTFSLRYIKENLTNLSPEFTNIYNSFIKKEQDFFNLNYSLDNYLADLKNNKNISRAHENLLTIDFATFKAKIDDIVPFIEKRNLVNHFLINKALQNCTTENLLSLGENTLINYPFLMNYSKKFLENQTLKSIYKKAIYHFYNHNENNYQKPTLKDFSNYSFDLDEKPFLLELAKNETYDNSYNDYLSIPNFTKTLTKIEFLELINYEDLKSLSKKEIAENLDKIREIWLTQFPKKSYWKNLKEIKSEVADLEIIFSEEFFRDLILASKSYNFISIDRNKIKKINFFNNLATKVAANFDDMLHYISFAQCITHFNELDDQTAINQNQVDTINSLIEKRTPQFFHTDLVLDYKTEKNLYANNVLAFMIQLDIPPSINKLYFLLDTHNYLKKTNNFLLPKASELLPFITKIAKKLPNNEVQKLATHFNVPLRGQNIISSEDINNMFSYQSRKFSHIPVNTLLKLLDIDPEFREYILKNNLQLAPEEKQSNNIWHSPDALHSLIQNIKSKEHKLFPFLQQYIGQNTLSQKYITSLLTHTLREHLISVDTLTVEQKNYQLLISLAKEKNLLEEKQDKEKDIVNKKIQELKNSFSVTFLLNQVQSLIEDKNYTDLYFFTSSQYKDNNKELFMKHISSLDFDSLLQALENPYFVKYINENPKPSRYSESKPHVIFNTNYTNEQNIVLANMLQLCIQSEDKNNTNKLLSYFSIKSKKFAKNFIIKNDSLGICYSNDYLPLTKEEQSEHLNCRYSNKEIIQIFSNIDKQYGTVFNHPDIEKNKNLSLGYFIANNFYKKEKEYLQLLSLLENNPLHYLLAAHSNNYESFLDLGQDKTYQFRGDAETSYLYKNLNIDLLIQGVNEVLSLIDNKFIGNDKIALNAVCNFLWTTAEQESLQSKKEYFSLFNEEQSFSLIKTIWDKAPLLLFSQSYIGCIDNVIPYVVQNFDKFYYDGFINNFLFDKQTIAAPHFNFSYDPLEHNYQKVHQLLSGLCEFLVNNKKINEIDYLIHLIEEQKFNDTKEWKKKDKELEKNGLNIFVNYDFKSYLENGKNMIDLTEKLAEKPIIKVKTKKI